MTGPPARRNLAEVLRDGLAAEDRLLGVLRAGPKTLPELAAALGTPVEEVTLWVMGLRRYGRVRDLPKPRGDDYYRYAIVEEGP